LNFDPRLPDDSVNQGTERPLLETFFLFIIIAGIALASFEGLGRVLDWGIPKISYRAEQRLFGSVFNRILLKKTLGDKKISDHQKAEAELKRIVDDLLATQDVPYKNDLKASISCDEDPNAFAFPGGGIVVTSGLLAAVKSEIGLAFVLGHEIGHFHHRDHLKGVGRGLLWVLISGLMGISEIGFVGGPSELVMLAHSRGQERAADSFAKGLLKKTYGNTSGATEFFHHISGLSKLKAPEFFSTHPASKARIEALDASASEGEEPVKLPDIFSKVCPTPSEPETDQEKTKRD